MQTSVAELDRSATIEHYNAVMLEELRASFRNALEVTANWKDGLEAKIDALRAEMRTRFDTLEVVLRVHSEEIKVLKAGAPLF